MKEQGSALHPVKTVERQLDRVGAGGAEGSSASSGTQGSARPAEPVVPPGPSGRLVDRVGAKVVDSPRVDRWTWRLLTSRFGRYLRDRLTAAQCRAILKEIRRQPVPRHVGIIMDGNRRFARKAGLDPLQGHLFGRHKLEEVLAWCLEADVRILTVYAFSTENFQRAPAEVDALMALFERNFREIADHPKVHSHKIRVRVLGRLDLLPPKVREAAEAAMERTRSYDAYQFNVAVAYGGREEIVNAIQDIAAQVQRGELAPRDVDEAVIQRHLYTNGIPDPDLILRTSGEERISNFLLWQSAYSELYFSDVYWPGLRKKDFLRAIQAYQRRRRRYGA